MDPFEKFELWLDEAKAQPEIAHPTAMCLSTSHPDGVARGRMMDLRCVDRRKFVFSTHSNSRKVEDLAEYACVSLTFWWDILKKQVRIQGVAYPVAEAKDNEYFALLPRRGQLLAHVVSQGADLLDENVLREQIENKAAEFGSAVIPRPRSWNSYAVEPREFEFMSLSADRLHFRQRFFLDADRWLSKRLQP